MVITGDPSSELQQYLHLPGHPSVGMIMIWKGFFIQFCFSCEGMRVTEKGYLKKDEKSFLPV
jgi:molybdenum cofactor biosynthesis enzyme MoaA